MNFNIKKRDEYNLENYKKEDFDIALEFAKEIQKEFKGYVKSVVLFGSTAKQINKNHHDIDILIILDDVSIILNKEFNLAYKIIIQNLVEKISKKIHITTLKFTNFWEFIRVADPIIINILRDGVALIDSGFFDPLQILLKQGKIRPTQESIWTYYSKAEISLLSSKKAILNACIELYWACTDAAHAALMSVNTVPVEPKQMSKLIKEQFVNTKIIDKKYTYTITHTYNLMKAINKGEISYISGEQYDNYYKEAKAFIAEMKKIIKK